MVQISGNVGGFGPGGVTGQNSSDAQGMPSPELMSAARSVLDEFKDAGTPPSPEDLKAKVEEVASETGVDEKELMELVFGAVQKGPPGAQEASSSGITSVGSQRFS